MNPYRNSHRFSGTRERKRQCNMFNVDSVDIDILVASNVDFVPVNGAETEVKTGLNWQLRRGDRDQPA